jgi:hypothetical protein
MEISEITPLGTPASVSPPRVLSSNSNSTPPSSQLLVTRPNFKLNSMVTAHLVPHSEHEVSTSTHFTPTASPQMGPRLHFAPTPSPDSAIHSASGYYSPSQSPVQSRHVSGLSSPFSLRGTPCLSRNNSDASQHGGSPMSPANQSPHDSPVQTRQPLTLPSSPLPQSATRHLSLYHGVILSRHEEARRSPSGGEMQSLNGHEVTNGEASSLSAQPGISRQQLINRYCNCGDHPTLPTLCSIAATFLSLQQSLSCVRRQDIRISLWHFLLRKLQGLL